MLVIDTTGSAASLLLETAARRQVPVAYVTGLAMHRAADLYAGAAKTDLKGALVLADYAHPDLVNRPVVQAGRRCDWARSQPGLRLGIVHVAVIRARPPRPRLNNPPCEQWEPRIEAKNV